MSDNVQKCANTLLSRASVFPGILGRGIFWGKMPFWGGDILRIKGDLGKKGGGVP